jgi:hypothetical protein
MEDRDPRNRDYQVIDGPAVVLGHSECRPEDESPLDELAAITEMIARLKERQEQIKQRRDELVNDNPGLKAR